MKKLLYISSFAAIFAIAVVQQGCDPDPELVEPNILISTDTIVVVSTPPNIENLKMNELQTIGSHNSYKIKTYQPLLDFLLILGTIDGNDTRELDYTHEPLLTQFDSFNIRSIEIDTYYDPNGGLFYNRQGNALIGESTASNEPELQNPGFKVLHIADIDYLTHHLTFVSSLTAIKNWSDDNPSHLPLIVMIEAKDDGIPLLLYAVPIPYDASAFDALEAEVQTVFGPDLGQVVTPDEFRGSYSTPNEAAMAGAWPTLAQARGSIYFVLMLSSAQKDDYLSGHPALAGRSMFVFGNIGDDETAFAKFDDPVGNQDTIQSLVQAGYMIRTRCDAGTWQSRDGDYSRMEMAFSSGAQMLSTDYYRPDDRAGTDPDWSSYSASFPNKELAVVNPVNGPTEYVGISIND